MAFPMPDAAPVTRRDAGGVGFGFGHPGQFRFLQGPVFDPEFLGFLDRGVAGDALRAAHDVDRVEVILAGDPGGLLVLSVGEHADAWDQDDGRIRTSQGRGILIGVAVVVGLVILTVGGMQLLEPGDGILQGGLRRQVQDQWFDLGAQEIVRTRGAQRAEARVFGTFEEVQDDGVVGEVPQLRFVRGRQPADDRGQRGGLRPPFRFRQGGVAREFRSERIGPAVLGDVLFGLLDDPQRVGFSLLAGSAQAVVPWPPRMVPMACGLASLIAAMSRPSWNQDGTTGTQATLFPKMPCVSASPSTAVAIAIPRPGAVVHMAASTDRAWRSRSTAWRHPSRATIIERRDHLVLTLDARVHVLQRVEPA